MLGGTVALGLLRLVLGTVRDRPIGFLVVLSVPVVASLLVGYDYHLKTQESDEVIHLLEEGRTELLKASQFSRDFKRMFGMPPSEMGRNERAA